MQLKYIQVYPDVITKQEINQVLRSAADELRQGIAIGGTNAKALIFSLVNQVNMQDDELELLMYLCHKLADNGDYVKSYSEAFFFRSISKEIYTTYPKIGEYMGLYLMPSQDLLELLEMIPAPSLKERVKIANVSLEDQFLDPITSYIMEYPVTYIVNNIRYTIDLSTLLTGDSGMFALKCPFTRQYILMEDLQPRPDMINAVLQQCGNVSVHVKEQDAIKHLCILAQNNDINGLKNWRISNPYLNCSTILKDPSNKLCTALHIACGANAYEAAIWLLEQGALPTIKNASQSIPLEYLKPRMLKEKVDSNRKTNGLLLLLALYNLYVDYNELEYEKIVRGLAMSGYVPAMYWHGLFLCENQKSSIENKNTGFEFLCEAAKNEFYLAANNLIRLLENNFTVDANFLGEDTSLKMDIYFNVAMKMLSSDAAILDRAAIETYFIKNVWHDFSNESCTYFKLLRAYSIACLAQTRSPDKSKFAIMKNMIFLFSAVDLRQQFLHEKFLRQQSSIDAAILRGDTIAMDNLFNKGAQFYLRHVTLSMEGDKLNSLKWLIDNNKNLVNIDSKFGSKVVNYLVKYDISEIDSIIDTLLDDGKDVKRVLLGAVKGNNSGLVLYLLSHAKCGIIDFNVLSDAINMATRLKGSQNILNILKNNRDKYYVYSIFKLKHINRIRYKYENLTFANKILGFIVDNSRLFLEMAGCIFTCYNVALTFHMLILIPALLLGLLLCIFSGPVGLPVLYFSFALLNFSGEIINAEAEFLRCLLNVIQLAISAVVGTLRYVIDNVLKPMNNFVCNKVLLPIYDSLNGCIDKNIMVSADSSQPHEAGISNINTFASDNSSYTKYGTLLFASVLDSDNNAKKTSKKMEYLGNSCRHVA